MSNVVCSIAKLAQRFGREQRGIAALEFALIAPVLLALYLGATELSFAYILQRKVTQTAADVSDLVTREKTVTASAIDGMFRIADSILLPFDKTTFHIRSTAVQENGSADPTILWSRSNDGTSAPTLTAIKAMGPFSDSRTAFVVIVDASRSYQMLGGTYFGKAVTLSSQAVNRSRKGNPIACTGC